MTDITNAMAVEKRYFPVENENPIFQNVIQELISKNLYTSALYDPASPALLEVATCKNGNNIPSTAVPLDVLVDIVTRNVLRGLRDGFIQTVLGAPVPKDASSNINFRSTIGTGPGAINLGACTNVREAIETLTVELMGVKSALGIVVPNESQRPSITEMTKLNKLILE
jgi:hypothetical protein